MMRHKPACATNGRPAIRGAVLLVSALGVVAGVATADADDRLALQQPPTEHRITGTLSNLDLSAGKGIVMTDLGKPIFFLVTRPDLFAHLSIGDRVTVQLDEEGRAVKVIEASPAEMHEPPPTQ